MRPYGVTNSAISDSYQFANAENQSSPTSGPIIRKEKSEKDGKLIVMLPGQLAGRVAGVELINAVTGKVLAKGRYSGIGNQHTLQFRFDRAGDLYPQPNEIRIKYI